MYFSEGLLLQNLSTQQFLIIKCYKDPFFLQGSYGFLFLTLCIIQQGRHVFFLQASFFKINQAAQFILIISLTCTTDNKGQ